MSHGQAIIIGCGAFGAQVTAHLEVRAGAGLRLLTVDQPARVELLRSLEVPRGGAVFLVGEADDPVGGRVLLKALAELVQGHECQVWLSLPGVRADSAAEGPAHATMGELEALHRSGGRFAAWLHERGGDQRETAQRFGDAILYHSRRGTPRPDGEWRGFGLGVVRDPAVTLKQRLSCQVAVGVVEHYLRSPDPAHLLPGLKDALQRPIRPFFTPVTECPVFAQRWSRVKAGEGSLEALLDYYEPERDWHRQAWRFWDGLIAEARKALPAAMGYAWRSGFEVIYQEARMALAQAHTVLEEQIGQCERSVAEHQERFEAALLAVEQGSSSLTALDELVAGYLLESMRLGALERLALAIDGAVELVVDGLWAKALAVRRLLLAIQDRQVASPDLAQALDLPFSAEQEQAWLSEIQPRLTRAVLYDSPSPDVDAVLQAAERDVERYIRTRNPLLHLPGGSQEYEAWLEGTLPALRLHGIGQTSWTCEISPGLPEAYREALRARAVSVQERSVEWLPGEWVVFAETPPVAVSWAASLPPIGEAAASLFGDPVINLPQARAALRAALLGLVGPDQAGHLALRSSVDGHDSGYPVGSMTDLLAGLAAGGSLATQLERLAAQRWEQLPPPGLAGYHALLRWFQTAILDGDRGGLDRPHLLRMFQAVEVERGVTTERLAAMGEEWLRQAEELPGHLGSTRDQVTVAAGPWRCLKLF